MAGRRAAIKWLLNKTSLNSRGIAYFADDDNTYDLRLFHELLAISYGKVGMWPVGLISPFGVSGPIVDKKSGKVVAFISDVASRKFPVDMAGFAVHLSLLHVKKPEMPYRATWEEEGFLTGLDLR